MKTNCKKSFSGWATFFTGCGVVCIFGYLVVLYFFALTFRFLPRFERDYLGNRPRDVVAQYIQHCQSGDFAGAEKLWSAGSVAYMNRAYPEDGFQGICQDIAALDLKYRWASYGNTKQVVHLQASDDSQKEIRNFYFVKEAGVWRLDWPEP
ncbi:hypothetical protein [Cerasicoccus fimbriatus]|uniref:hypothetical protein n=1 Tax=Cerasicoccus fimbriatus TaxID=3014554 RepID=UPI0022B588E6|nr:hypothetical protein [Cerasicoccus sp. TK19100]